MENLNKQFVELIDILKQGIKRDKTSQMISALKDCNNLKLSEYPTNTNNDIAFDVDLILEIVSKNYGMRKNVMINTNKRGKFYEAKKMCFYLLDECLAISTTEIAKIFKRKQPQVQLEITIFNRLDKKNKVDMLYLQKYELLKNEFLNKKQ